MSKEWIVVDRQCDASMARSKGLIGGKEKSIGKCTGHCERCIACIETDINGERRHHEGAEWKKKN